MDDSNFLPKDLVATGDLSKVFTELENAIHIIDKVFSEACERNNFLIVKEYQECLYKKLRNLHTALGRPSYSIANSDEIELRSNIMMDITDLLGQIDFLARKKLVLTTLLFDKRFALGVTENMRRYILRLANITESDIHRLESLGEYFLYDTFEKTVFIFKSNLLPIVLKHLLFAGEDVQPIQILRKLEGLLK